MNKETKPKSKCCRAPVKVVGMNDFIGSKDIGTFHYECENCGKPCDVILSLKKESQNWRKEFNKRFYGWKCWYDEKELKTFIRQLLKKQKEEFSKVIQKRLDYCREQNGLPYCKNCGLGEGDLEKLKNQL